LGLHAERFELMEKRPMTESQGAGAGSSGSNSQGAAAGAGAGSVDAAAGASKPGPEFHQPGSPNPRSRGFSPARDAAEGRAAGTQGASSGDQQAGSDPGQGQQGQQSQQGSGAIEIDGVSWTHDQVREAIAGRVEQDVRKAALPQSANDYQVTLPADFKPPEGVKFEFDANSADLRRFREVAHARGLDQDTFSEALGVYASTKISEQQQLAHARGAEMAKLGSAAPGRIDAIDTWLKARVGQNGALMAAQLRNYPVAGMVEMFEGLMKQFSGQGGADFTQSGRHEPDNTGKVPGYETMSFIQRRAAQDAAAGRPIQPGRGR
jgi:hypothetical protein